MYKACSCFSSSTLLQFYKTYAKPLISYGLLVYDNSSWTLLNKVFVMQKRIIRTIFFKKKYEHIGNIFEKFKIKSVFDMFFNQLLNESILQHLNVSCIKLLQGNPAPTRSTRRSEKGFYILIKLRSKIVEKSLANTIRRALNSLIQCNLIPDNLDSYSTTQLNRFFTKICENYFKGETDSPELVFLEGMHSLSFVVLGRNLKSRCLLVLRPWSYCKFITLIMEITAKLNLKKDKWHMQNPTNKVEKLRSIFATYPMAPVNEKRFHNKKNLKMLYVNQP